MVIKNRRAREREAREELILAEADEMLAQQGYLGLNLDHLAARIEYAKATIYNHFTSKEDLIVAITVRHNDERARLFARALVFPGNTRERLCCMGAADEILITSKPHSFSLLQLAQTRSIWDKATAHTQEAFGEATQRIVEPMIEIIRQARATGELTATTVPDEQIVSGLIALSKGTFLLASEARVCDREDLLRAEEHLFANYNAYLDGLGWSPLAADWDYDATRERARAFLRHDQPDTVAAQAERL